MRIVGISNGGAMNGRSSTSSNHQGLGLVIVLVAAFLSLPAASQTPPPTDFPEAVYREAAARGQPVYRVQPNRSRLIVRVNRGGALSAFGHEHVVSSRQLQGYVLPPTGSSKGRADIYLPLETLEVDDPDLLRELGLGKAPSQEDVAATRRNMMQEVLEAGRYPYIQLRIRNISAIPRETVSAQLLLHGEQRRLELPVTVQLKDDEMIVSSGFPILQTDFGITPFSAFGGTLRVADRLDLRVELTAER